MLIAIVNQKGGCGKSTTALHYAAWCVRRGLVTLLIDADVQKSSSAWAADLDPPIESERISSAEELIDRLTLCRDQGRSWGVDRVVVDAPAGLAEESRAILFLADVAIVPIQPSGLDMRSSGDAFYLIRQAQRLRRGGPIARSFLSRSDSGTRLEREAVTALDAIDDIPRLSTIVHQRTAIADASVQRCTVHDRRPRDALAIAEMDALCAEIDAAAMGAVAGNAAYS